MERTAEHADALGGGLSSVLEAPPTPQRRRGTNVDLREELAAATAAIKDQKWVKALAQRVGRRDGDTDADTDVVDADVAKRRGSDVAVMDALLLSPAEHATARRASVASLPSPVLPGTPHAPLQPSVLVPQSSDDMLTTLDPRFFTKGFDASAYVLENLPKTRDALDQFLQTEISAVDVAKDVIVAKLANDVRANHDAFIEGMKQVQDVDLDLVRAQIHVKNARRLIVSTKNDLVKGSLEIVKTKRNRDRVVSIIDLGSRIVRCFEDEERMNGALQKHAFTTAVDICLALRREVSVAELQGVSILKKLIHRVQHFLPELRSQFDKSLRQVAQQFDPLQYKELLLAYITLADHAENLGFEFSARHLSEVLCSIPDIMVRCIDELTRHYLTELFGERSSPRKHKVSTKGGAAVKPTTSVSGSSTPSMAHTIDKVQRAYERLTELMHTYYLLVQWHRDPFNPNNDDLAYLHRCGIDDDDDDDEDVDDDDGDGDESEPRNSEERGILSPGGGSRKSFLSPQRRRTSSISSELQASQRSPYSQVLCETGMTLLRYRKIVWETMQQNVMEVLERLDTTYGFKLEHIITLSQTTFAFIDVGEEFTGCPSTKLRSMLRLKCEQYIASFHDDNIELLRMLVDTESWQRILSSTSAVSTYSSMLRLVEKRSGYRFDDGTSAASASAAGRAPIHERSVFPSFPSKGNPFSPANASRWYPLKHDKTANNGKSDVEEAEVAAAAPAKSEEPESPELDESAIANGEAMDEEFVLTSSSLSGFVRMCGVYLKMMHHLPHVAWDVFLLLVKLLEFNVYAVFVSFVEPAHAQQLFHAQLPDSGHYSVLCASIAAISRDFASGEVVLRTYVAAANGSAVQLQGGEREIVTLRRVTRLPSAMEQAGEANCYAFAERAVAAASVVSQTLLLEALKPLVRTHIAERFQPLMEEVYARCEQSALQLRGLVYGSMASAALASDPTLSIAAMVASVRWGELSYLSDRHNDYVVHIVRKCGEVWGAMQIYSDGVVPVGARDDAWAALVQHVMDALLASLAGVAKCTPQGRALMSMDLVALQNGLDLINHVSRQRVPRGYDHVNGFVKAFYFGEDDLVDWIRRHRHAYSKAAIASLLRHGVGSSLAKKDLRELVLRIDAILAQP